MSTDEIQKIQDDLATIRQAVTKDKPYDRADIFPLLVLAVGALIAILMLQTRISPRLCFLVGMAPGFVCWCVRYFQTRNQRAVRPGLWAEYKWSLVAGAIMIPALVGWMWWSQQFGTSRIAVGAAVMFCIGIAACLIGFIDPNRRTYLPAGITVIIFAVLLPTLGPKQIPIAGFVFLAILGFGGAAMIWWMTRGGLEDASRREMSNE